MISRFMKELNLVMQRNMLRSAHQFVVVGALSVLLFPLFYWIWVTWYPQPYESLALRLIACVLGLGLMLTPYWPSWLRPLIPWYWFFSLLYSLPFFFIYMFLMNRASDASSMALLCSVFLLVLLVDVWSLSLLLILGSALAFLCYFFVEPEFYFANEHVETSLLVFFVVIAGSTVNYKTAVVQRQRLKGMAAVAGMIGHELRTPLLGIKSGSQALQQFLPSLFAGYRLAIQHQLISSPIRDSRLKQLETVNNRIINEVNYANTIIDMLLVKAGRENSLSHCPLTCCSMKACLDEAMERYPFRSPKFKALVTWSGDFEFMGSKVLMQHVLFNLLKNALYAIAKAQRGEITIWSETEGKYHCLYFKDTATGMSPNQLARLFEHFYTTTFMGTGIGLSFCKMVMNRFGGDIFCASEEGKYTKFTLTFPVICI